MGSWSSYNVDADTKNDKELEEKILAKANDHDSFKGTKETFEWVCWRRWNEPSKWGADDLVDYLSKSFPEVIFRLRCKGDYNYDVYYLDGKCVNKEYVNPHKFPSNAAVKRGLKDVELEAKRQQEAYKLKMLADEKAKLAKLEAEALELRKKIQANA